MIVLCRKLIFEFEHLHLQVASPYILFREHLLSSSLHCKLCSPKHYCRPFPFQCDNLPGRRTQKYVQFCTKSAALLYKTFGNALLTLIPCTFQH